MVHYSRSKRRPAFSDGQFPSWTEMLAGVSAAVIQVGDPLVVAEGSQIKNTATGYSVAIWAGCNGVEASIVWIAAMIAYPSSWIGKLTGMALGIAGIQGLNLCRIISLFYIGEWNNTAFEAAHLYFWPCLIILDALIIFLLWVRWQRRPRPAFPHG